MTEKPPLKILVDQDWVNRAADLEDGCEVEAGTLHPEAPGKIELPGLNEGFYSVTNWCDETFPPSDDERLTRFNRVLEEVVELGVSMGIPLEQMMSVISIVASKCVSEDVGNDANVPGESADVQITLWYLQRHLKIDPQRELDKRMQRNRSRTPEYYAEKRVMKDKLGL